MNRTILLGTSLGLNLLLLATIGFLIREEPILTQPAMEIQNARSVTSQSLAGNSEGGTSARPIQDSNGMRVDAGSNFVPHAEGNSDRGRTDGVAEHSRDENHRFETQIPHAAQPNTPPEVRRKLPIAMGDSQDSLTAAVEIATPSISGSISQKFERTGLGSLTVESGINGIPTATTPMTDSVVNTGAPALNAGIMVNPKRTPRGTTQNGNRTRPPWPRGVLTPEQELYRMQYGWAASVEALREESLNSKKQ